MRLLHIHAFFGKYLTQFYRNNNYLKAAPFEEQMSALLQDGYSAIHIIAPYMETLGYETQCIVWNCLSAQHQWAREHDVVLDDTDDWQWKIVKKQIEVFKPDILYIADPTTLDSRLLRELVWKPALVIGWHASDIPYGTDWSTFDVMLSSLSKMRKHAVTIGAKHAEHFFPGFPSWINEKTQNVKQECDVVFTGRWTRAQHERRNFYLTHVAQASQEGQQFSCRYYLSGKTETVPYEVAQFDYGERFGIAMHKALLTGKIVIDARGSIGAVHDARSHYVDLADEETANMRIFEATGSGAFLLAEYHKNLKDYFVLGKEIETFHNENELIEKIHYYLNHVKERESIAQRGHVRCLQDYSIEKRAMAFDTIIRRYLCNKDKNYLLV